MSKNAKKSFMLLMVLMLVMSSVFATGTEQTDVVSAAMSRVAKMLNGPTIGMIFIGLFMFKMVWAYSKHNSQPDAMKKEIISAAGFAIAICAFLVVLSWILGGTNGSLTTTSGGIGNFASGLQGAVVAPEYAINAIPAVL